MKRRRSIEFGTPDPSRYSREPVDRESYTRQFDRAYTRAATVYDVAVRWLPVWKTWLAHATPHIVGPRVLEVSFGTGWLLSQYAGRFETYGVDYNAAMIRRARRNLTRCKVEASLQQANVEALPFRDAAFDSVVSTMAFSGYPSATKALFELRRVLRPGGRIVMIDVNFPVDSNWLGTWITRTWQRAGDLVRNLDGLFSEFGFRHSDAEIGGFGSVHLYVATKQ